MKSSKKFKTSVLNLNRAKKLKSPRNNFDMSYHSYFTSPLGMMLPNYCEDLVPGDQITIKTENFSRTQPVNTSAFSRFQECTDFYFVPYRLLWKWWDNFINQQKNTKSSLFPNSSATEQAFNTVPGVLSSKINSILLDSSKKDDFNYPVNKGAERLLDLLGYPVSNDSSIPTRTLYELDEKGDQNYDRNFNFFRFLAYQRIWNDYYRNTDYSENNPPLYNIDDCYNDTIRQTTSAFDRIQDIMTPRYVQWRKDRTTSLKPKTVGTDEGFDIENLQPTSINGYTIPSGLSSDAAQSADVLNYIEGQGLGDTIESIRSFTAYDKLLRVKALAGKSFDEQYSAIFGGTTDKANYNECSFIGSTDSMLNIGEVTATASGETSSGSSNVLGQLAGKGISSGQGKTLKFTASEHGIVMGIHYFIPFSEYDSNRLNDFNNKLDYHDFHNPAFDNLGFGTLPVSTFNYMGNNSTTEQVAGYQPRYMEYKTRLDEVHGEFQSKRSLSAWAATRTVQFPDSAGLLSYKNMYVNPAVSNTLFALSYDGTQLSDPFLCHFKFNVNIHRNMSVLGLPNY